MDLHSVSQVVKPLSRAGLQTGQPGSAYLAGGTWLFSEPQPGVGTLVDLTGLGWPALEPLGDGLHIGATCTIAALAGFAAPPEWTAAHLIAGCCRALLGSFKIWAVATVGGNVCLALAASPMLALTAALDGTAHVWTVDGGERLVPMSGFATGPQQTVLAPGEVLRGIHLPAEALRRRAAMRQASLTQHGRSAALLVATLNAGGAFALTVTASTCRPIVLRWTAPPTATALDEAVAGLAAELWYDDVHGTPAWRRHMTRRLAAELHKEVLG